MLGDYELVTLLPPEGEYPMELSVMFDWYPNLIFLASPWLEIIDFQTSHFADSKFKVQSLLSSKLSFILLILGKPKLTLSRPFLLTLDISLLFYWVWVKLSLFDNNSRTMRIRSGTSHFQWSIQWESRIVFFSQ